MRLNSITKEVVIILYVYTNQEKVKNLLKDIQDIKIIDKIEQKWKEDFEITDRDKILLISGRPIQPLKYEKNMIGSFKGYQMVSDKIEARFFMESHNISVPKTYYIMSNAKYPYIARPRRHSVNRNFFIIYNEEDRDKLLSNPIYPHKRWYYSELIKVAKEYRVMIMDGDIFLVYNRMTGNSIEETLNIRDQARATNSLVRYECQNEVSQEDLDLCLRTMKTLDVGYGAVDLIIDSNGKSYIVEINSTPFLNGDIVKEAFVKQVAVLAKRYKND